MAISLETRQYGRDDVDFETWYSPWMKQLAKSYTKAELEKRLGIAASSVANAARTHLRAIQASHSMSSQSQRRAQSRNVVAATGEERIALSGALEIHDLFPEHAKLQVCPYIGSSKRCQKDGCKNEATGKCLWADQ